MSSHSNKSEIFLRDSSRAAWHDETLWGVRKKRDKAVSAVPEWEELRNLASDIKEYVLSDLPALLGEFEANAIKNGAKVHRASDAAEFNEIVYNLLNSRKISKVVKSKSMLTEECGMNHFLEERGIEVVDTDLGERIIQFRKEMPSHIVLPAIHLKREQIGATFHKELGTPAGCSDPQMLTSAARAHLREKFLNAEAAISGVNFAVAESGTVVICTNEGNADMGINASAPLQIHCMGIEKIVPGFKELGVFTRMLARNATGQSVTTYTSHYTTPKHEGEMHIIILDNGRSERLNDPLFRNSLKCIRCGACMNTCPVYRRSGGHSYGYLIPGPIGSILGPCSSAKIHSDLPFASSLCGSCSNVCPVKIDLHDELYKWRQVLSQKRLVSPVKRFVMKITGVVLASGKFYSVAGRSARIALKYLPRPLLYNRLNTWGIARELPAPPKESFNEWYRKNVKKREGR